MGKKHHLLQSRSAFYIISGVVVALLIIANVYTLHLQRSSEIAEKYWLTAEPLPTPQQISAFLLPTLPPTATPGPILLASVPMPLPLIKHRQLRPCDGTSIEVSKIDVIDGMGHRGADLVLHNVGPVACMMQGYAAIRVLRGRTWSSLQGDPQPSWHASEPSFQVAPVPKHGGSWFINVESHNQYAVQEAVLEPGGDAFIGLNWAANGEMCTVSAQLIVTPPGSATQAKKAVPLNDYTCDGWMLESPVSQIPYFWGLSGATHSYSGYVFRVAANYISAKSSLGLQALSFFFYPATIGSSSLDDVKASDLWHGRLVHILYDSTVPGIRHVDCISFDNQTAPSEPCLIKEI